MWADDERAILPTNVQHTKTGAFASAILVIKTYQYENKENRMYNFEGVKST